LKAVREKKQVTYKGKPIKIIADFSTETLKARRAWGEIFRALNENNFNPRILSPAKLSFKIDGAIKVFHDKQKLKNIFISLLNSSFISCVFSSFHPAVHLYPLGVHSGIYSCPL
jgi:hypothetical protein